MEKCEFARNDNANCEEWYRYLDRLDYELAKLRIVRSDNCEEYLSVIFSAIAKQCIRKTLRFREL